MLEKFLLDNGFQTKTKFVFSGHGMSVSIRDKECLILDSSDDEFDKLYEGDHSGAIEFISQRLDL